MVDYRKKMFKRIYFETSSSDDEVVLQPQMFEYVSDQQSQITHAHSNLQEVPSSVLIGNQKKPSCGDRISALHESILHHIMSFMPAHDVVRTSTLSPRWRPLWTSAPCLDIDIDIDIDHFDLDRVKFNKFAESLFQRWGIDTLDTLRLHSFAIDAANFWIDHAIKRNVKSIEFTEYTRWEPFYLDPQLIEFPSPYLRSLKLTNVILVACVFDQLNHACPTLENLQLSDSTLDFPEISSRSLKTLEIIDCTVLKHLLICTHKLVSLSFKGSRCGCTLKSIFLIKSIVTLCGLSNAKSVELSVPVRQVAFARVTPNCTMFINLTSLSVGEWCLSNKLSPLIRFLRHSPMLENLYLKLKYDCEEEEQPIHMAKGISFEAERLKKVTIHCTKGDERVPVLLEILHANARSVKHIDVETY
ncbi:hypothetical protein ACQ4PT_065303 [Festuca glaucescens]